VQFPHQFTVQSASFPLESVHDPPYSAQLPAFGPHRLEHHAPADLFRVFRAKGESNRASYRASRSPHQNTYLVIKTVRINVSLSSSSSHATVTSREKGGISR
jgi:hypothetical protein